MLLSTKNQPQSILPENVIRFLVFCSVLLFNFLVSAGEVRAETLTVKGTGQDWFYVYDTAGKELGYRHTNKEIELFPGTYTVTLNGTSQTTEVQGGQKTVLIAGVLTTSGTGQDWFYVYDTAGKELGYRHTGKEIELFPGTYTTMLNGTTQTANVQADQKAVLVAGVMTTSGTGQDWFYVYNTAGKELGYRHTNKEIELFPGSYTVTLNSTTQIANIQAGQKTTLVAGILRISGNGQDWYYVYDTTGKELGYRHTNNEIELFAGTYTVKLNGSTQTYTVEAGGSSTEEITPPVVDTPQPTDPPTVTDSTSAVTIYKHCGYGGYAINLAPGTYTYSTLLSLGMINDDISAITVPAGLTATLYQDDLQGNSWTFTSNDDCFVDNGLNDVVSSIKVENTATATSTGNIQPPVAGNQDFQSGKQEGVQQCVTNPTAYGINVTSGTPATFDPSTGELHIPLINVPDALGGTQTYEVYLTQQPLTFTFDLDMNRIIQK